jgi:hypothetical protein
MRPTSSTGNDNPSLSLKGSGESYRFNPEAWKENAENSKIYLQYELSAENDDAVILKVEFKVMFAPQEFSVQTSVDGKTFSTQEVAMVSCYKSYTLCLNNKIKDKQKLHARESKINQV